jgi:hypothetical protein
MDSFWENIKTQLTEMRKAKSSDDVIRILGGKANASVGDAFFAGSGGNDGMMDALSDAGWDLVWASADYNFVMRAPNGDMITYCEGDVDKGDTSVRSGS